MSNVYYTTYMSFADNVYAMMNDILPIFTVVQACLAAEQVLNPSWSVTDMTVEEKNATLKKLTGLVYALESDLNCYPLGLDTSISFDIDGEEVP